MFWQGGGKKRLRYQIEKIMEVPHVEVESGVIGKNDDQLLIIYYNRHINKPITHPQQPTDHQHPIHFTYSHHLNINKTTTPSLYHDNQ